MRDNRDPEKLGKKFLAGRKKGVPIARAVNYKVPDGHHNDTCIQKYGRPDDVQEYWERIQIR